MNDRLFCVAMLAAVVAVGDASAQTAAQTQAAIDTSLITQAEATTLAQASIQACNAQGMAVTAQVVDADGHLRVSLSSEHASLAGINSAPQKAAAVMTFHVSTRDLQARVASDPGFAAQYGKDPRYHFSPGALPLYKDGKFVAVLAVGGGRTVDESCALEALKSVPWAKIGK